MEEVAVDKSKVTVRVPKRLWKGRNAEWVEWHEYKLKTRRMPNGYTVTISAVCTDSQIFLGASACSPGDCFHRKPAYNLSIGRARQQAFQVQAGLPTIFTLLIDPAFVQNASVIWKNSRYATHIDGPIGEGWGIHNYSIATDPHVEGLGLVTGQTGPRQLINVVRELAEPYFSKVSVNAEHHAVFAQVIALEIEHGNRFRIEIA